MELSTQTGTMGTRTGWRWIWAILLFAGVGMVTVVGQTLPEGCLPPPQDRVLVMDEANLLSREEWNELNRKLVDYVDSTSNVIYVVTHPNFCGMDPSMFATAVGHEFGVGRSDRDNGIVIAIKPRKGAEDGRVFIAVGYGLEGAIPDALAQRVVDRMVPDFADGDWMAGLVKGTDDLRKLASGEFTEANYRPGGNKINWKGFLTADVFGTLCFLLLMAFFILAEVFHHRKTNNTGLWLSFIMVLSEVLRSGPGTYQNFSSGGGWGGGSRGGGGFGGFGGGGFGGGGAGGRF